MRGTVCGVRRRVAQQGAWSDRDLVWYPESTKRGRSSFEVNMRSIRDIVECVAEKQEKAWVCGYFDLQVSIKENSDISLANLVLSEV